MYLHKAVIGGGLSVYVCTDGLIAIICSFRTRLLIHAIGNIKQGHDNRTCLCLPRCDHSGNVMIRN